MIVSTVMGGLFLCKSQQEFPNSENTKKRKEKNMQIYSFKNIFEHSDFITHEVEGLRPFQNKLDVIDSFIKVFDNLTMDVKIKIIKSHPDLGDKIKIAEGLTEFSKQEQSGAGLANCNDEEYRKFHKLNDEFKAKFDIPFIFAIRGKSKSDILKEFETRLKSDNICLLYTSPSPRDLSTSRMPSSA